jgi:hypothetical protein
MKWVRTIGAAILGVIAVLGLLCSVVGFWARDTVFDEKEVAASVEAAIQEPGVSDALATRLTDRVMSALDLQTKINEVLPPPLQRFTPAIVGGTAQLLESRLSARLADTESRAVLVAGFERSYRAFLDVLEGDGLVDGITVEDDAVTVNFLPLIGEGLQAVQQFGLLDNVTIPELSREGEPSEQIAQLESGLGRDLPDDFGQIVVYRSASLGEKSETLERAQQLLIVAQRALVLSLIVTVVAIAGMVLVARNRLRATLWMLLGAAATFIVARALVNKVRDDLPSVARAPAGEAALRAVTSSLTEGLVKALGVLALLFVLGAFVVYVVDADSALRRRVATRTGTSSLRGAIAAYRVPVALVAAVAALLVVTIAGFSLLSLIVALALAVLAMFALWVPDDLSAGAPPDVPTAPLPDGTVS